MMNPLHSFVETLRYLLICLALQVMIFPTVVQAQSTNYLGVSINSELLRGAFISDLSLQYCPNPRSRIRAGLGGHFAGFEVSEHEHYNAVGPFAKLGLGYRLVKFGPDENSIQIGIGFDAALGLLRHKHEYYFPGLVYLDLERTYKETRMSSNLQLYVSAMIQFRKKYFLELSPVFSPSVYLMNGDAERYRYRSSAGFGISSYPLNMNLRIGKILVQKHNRDPSK